LLSQAAQVFAERGYHGTTLELVAEAAGVPETSLTEDFADKAALFRAVLDEARAATVERWRAATAVLPDPLAKLHAVAEIYLGTAWTDRPEVAVVCRALAECDAEDIAAPVRSLFLECEAFLAGILSEGQQMGVFRRQPDPRVGAWQVLHAGLGVATTRPLGLALRGEPECPARAVECLLHGLVKTDV
jgi:AcrR family transcriptional regulator